MKKKVRALCLVAHPDDESIWMGGTILKNMGWEWTIFSLSRKNDSDRMPKFKKVCEKYGAVGIISDLDDESSRPLTTKEIVKEIKQNLPRKEYDYIFTHGKNGEYGHIRHKEIHRAVEWMRKKGELKCGKLFNFSYVGGDEEAFNNPGVKIPVANSSADWVVSLDSSTWKTKRETVELMHGFPRNGFEVLASGRKEAFSLVK